MPFPVHAAILSTQLIVTVADRIPAFDSGPFCRTYSTGGSVQDCVTAEKRAHDKLIETWPRYTAHDRAMCVMEEKIAGPPSYMGWLTCLDINANARTAAASKSNGAGAPGAGTSGDASSRRSVHRRRPGAAHP